jgi:hypothetical protein
MTITEQPKLKLTPFLRSWGFTKQTLVDLKEMLTQHSPSNILSVKKEQK